LIPLNAAQRVLHSYRVKVQAHKISRKSDAKYPTDEINLEITCTTHIVLAYNYYFITLSPRQYGSRGLKTKKEQKQWQCITGPDRSQQTSRAVNAVKTPQNKRKSLEELYSVRPDLQQL